MLRVICLEIQKVLPYNEHKIHEYKQGSYGPYEHANWKFIVFIPVTYLVDEVYDNIRCNSHRANIVLIPSSCKTVFSTLLKVIEYSDQAYNAIYEWKWPKTFFIIFITWIRDIIYCQREIDHCQYYIAKSYKVYTRLESYATAELIKQRHLIYFIYTTGVKRIEKRSGPKRNVLHVGWINRLSIRLPSRHLYFTS